MAPDTVLEIIAQGAWNEGSRVDNSIYENKGLTFKGARTILYDSIGAGMTRSSFLQRKK